MRFVWYSLALALLPLAAAQGQELNCRVSVQVTTVQGVDRSIFQRMETDIAQYLNNRRWTTDVYQASERINCSITILISTADQPNNRYEGTAQVQATRPVYGSSYETVSFNFQDRFFNVVYAPFQALDYSEAAFTGNLTALLNTYALLILGFDYASFSPGGGIPYFQRAQNMANLAASSSAQGWRANDGRNTRYWVVENLLNNAYRQLHSLIYTYHREGLDQMAEKPKEGRAAIVRALRELLGIFQSNPDVYLVRVFLDAKTYELANLMKGAPPEQQQELLDILRVLDPSNLGTYRQALRQPNG